MNKAQKILVVDDTPIDVLLLSRLLRQEGYTVLGAEDGTSGYNMAVAQQPNLILLDVMMPGQDGYGVCRSLKENELTENIPVIFITARSEAIDKVRGLNAGGVDYVTKPFQPTEVMARIRTHLKLKAMHEENEEHHRAILQLQEMASVTILAGEIAHEINNLLGAIIGYLDMMQTNLHNDHEAYKYTDEALEVSQHASKLAEELLMYTRIGPNGISDIDVQELLKRMLILYGNGDLSKARIDIQALQDIPKIQANGEQILQALSHIFVNSREATPDDGIITISVDTGQLPPDVICNGSDSATETYVIVSISDTGSGMDEEMIGKIFDTFFTTKQSGTGLGLSAASSIIKKHRGAISVESKPGEGSTFHVYLPAMV